jgi:hypothetical protein
VRHARQRIFKYLLVSTVFVLAFHVCVFAQLRKFPLPAQSTPVTKHARQISGARQQATPRELPFFDDFSGTHTNSGKATDNQPVDSLWEKSNSVWINDGLAINAPSINVATFDGLDKTFSPYSAQLLLNGMRDTLMSVPILLGESSVPVAQRPSVYLSFFYQWQGNGEAPDPTDYLSVEFKNSSGEWKQVMQILPRASFDRTVFNDTIMQVTGDEYFHDDFQFRFRNYGRMSGPYDTWNVDYVYLNKSRNPDDTDFPDQAIATALSSLFGKYRSIPYDHFLVANAIERPTFEVSNNLNDYTDLTYLTEGTFINYVEGVRTFTYLSNLGGTDTSAINEDGSGIIFPLEKRIVKLEYIPNAADPAQFNPDADSVDLKLKVRLFTGDTFDPKTGGIAHDYDLNYRPIDFRVNDTTFTSYRLNNYYAYDDGVAEYSAGLTQAGNRAAVAFDMLKQEPDHLIGIDIYVPDYGLSSSNLTVDFTIYGDNNGLPGPVLYTIPSFTIQRKGQNVFQRIKILESLQVESRFHIGWKAPVGGTLKIGLDYNSLSDNQISVNTNGTWATSTDIAGSLMIRPVFGEGGTIIGVEDPSEPGVYPNPSTGMFTIADPFDSMAIFNATGQPVAFESYSDNGGTRVVIKQSVAGLYIIRLMTGNTYRTARVVVK